MRRALTVVVGWLFLVSAAHTAAAASDPAATGIAAPSADAQSAEVQRLREQIGRQQALIEEQQTRLDQLRRTLEDQRKALERVAAAVNPDAPARATLAASTTPVLPAAASPLPSPSARPQEAAAPAASPLTVHIGAATITPVGFMDFTAVFRDKTGGSGIGTNFGSIPFANTVPGNLSEFRLSAQNSRIGLRVDTNVAGANVLGYLESDFLGFSPGNAAVSSNSNSMRMRLYWADVRKNKWEILGGQSWSLLTPNRRGLSPLPSDLFYSQDMDVNYQVGLTWSRDPQFRVVYHPASSIAAGLSFEAAEQYGGGSAGGGTITLPSALANSYAAQVNTGGSTFAVPTLHPAVIGKIAFDPMVRRRLMHIEVAGLLNSFKFYNPLTGTSYAKTGGGGSVNLNLELFRNFHLIANTFYSDGGARWIFGQGPDLIVRGDGSPSLVRAASTVSGFEYQASKNTMVYAYYGGAYFGRNVAVDPATGKFVGYGYSGAPSSQNRSIQEGTFGLIQTLWKNPNYGALQFISQYSYLARSPWFIASGPDNAHMNMVFLDLRYTLPGAPPHIEQ